MNPTKCFASASAPGDETAPIKVTVGVFRNNRLDTHLKRSVSTVSLIGLNGHAGRSGLEHSPGRRESNLEEVDVLANMR